MALIYTGFAKLVITVLFIYRSTYATNLVMGSTSFLKKLKVQQREEESCDDYLVRLGS